MFQPDRRHIHHRLLALGFSHRNAVFCLYALALGLSSLALFSVLAQYRNAGVILVAVGLATYFGIRKLEYDEMTFFHPETFLRWCEQVQYNRWLVLGLVDMVLMALAYWGAFLLKYDGLRTAALVSWYGQMFPLVLVVQLTVFHTLGLYREVWRAAEIGDMIRVALGARSCGAFVYYCCLARAPRAHSVSSGLRPSP
jgi:hypothetical protein